ncbi:MAG TPA: SAM-dependent methyltransferase, partial [Leptospiraceae bacterium]|nr:SAM-dependent methyltransferase [Leptospiraceae bacterium]
AGSGDIRHLTIEAHSILSQADLILYDMYLEALNPYYPQAVWESVGKKKGFHVKKQSEINELLLAEVKTGKKVVRLKAGDVSFFARSSEEIQILKENGFACKLIMGISSPQLLSQALGESLTHRELTRSISYSSGYWDKTIQKVNLPDTDAHVIFMGLGELEKTVSNLLQSGKSEETSFIAASNLGRQNQKIVKATLGSAVQAVKDANLQSPTLIAIGLNHI